jgi:hypothetical protein
MPLKLRFDVLIKLGLAILSFTSPAMSQWSLDVETGIAWNWYNDVRVPGNTGTLFSLSEELKADATALVRFRVNYVWTERSRFSILAAPLRIQSNGTLDRPILFETIVFPSGAQLSTRFRFDSYRFTYAYQIHTSNRFDVWLGATGKIRSASIRVESKDQHAEKPDLGFVPLVNFEIVARLDEVISILFGGDALAAPQGRAEDIRLAVEAYVAPNVNLRVGYRVLEGGADASSVYTFTWVNYVIIGLTLDL